MRTAVTTEGPFAVVCKRKMCPGIEGVEGTNHGHDVIAVAKGITYLEKRGLTEAVEHLKSIEKTSDDYVFEGTGKKGSNRQTAGQAITDMIGKIPAAERASKVMVIDSDLGGSTGMTKVQDAYPEVYHQSGIMERGNFSAAAGFGMEEGKQGICSTFAAFQEMCISEITMARLNKSNVLSHYSHSGCDDMADNTCHFGLNNMFADNGLDEGSEDTMLYFPADFHQVRKCVETIFHMPGLRFLYTIRSKTPEILAADGTPFFGDGYTFVPGKDDIVKEGKDGYIITFGDCAYRCVDAVTKLAKEGIDIGIVIKSCINVVDEDAIKVVGNSPLCLIVEPLNSRSGLASRYGSWLLKRGLAPKKFDNIGISKEGSGGLWEHAYHQGYDPKSVMDKVKAMRA